MELQKEALAVNPRSNFIFEPGIKEFGFGEIPAAVLQQAKEKLLPLFLGRLGLEDSYVRVRQYSKVKSNRDTGILPGIVTMNYFIVTICFGVSGPSLGLLIARARDPQKIPGTRWTEQRIREACAWINTVHRKLFDWSDGHLFLEVTVSPLPKGKRHRDGIGHPFQALLVAVENFGQEPFLRTELLRIFKSPPVSFPNATELISRIVTTRWLGVVKRGPRRYRNRAEDEILQVTDYGFKEALKIAPPKKE